MTCEKSLGRGTIQTEALALPNDVAGFNASYLIGS